MKAMSTTSGKEQGSLRFTPSRSIFRLGMVGAIFWSCVLIASAVAMYVDSEPDKDIRAIVFFVLSWSFFMGLSLWMVLAYHRASITIQESEILLTGVFSRYTFRLDDIRRARWRPGSLKLFGEKANRTVYLEQFRSCNKREIVRILHAKLDPGVQEGWDERFEAYVKRVSEFETARVYDSFYYRLFARMLIWGPIAGLGCGLFAATVPDMPVWSGSAVADWTLCGIPVSMVGIGSLWVGKWVDQPEDIASTDRDSKKTSDA